MSKGLLWVATFGLLSTLAASANAQYQWFENFEAYVGTGNPSPWQLWTERGTNQSSTTNVNEEPDLGNVAGWSGINRNFAYVGGSGFNGGIYQVINLPLGAGTYTIDGYWRSSNVTAQNAWAEVIVVEGNNPPTNGQDLTAPLHYKNDTFGGGPTWDGLISSYVQQGGALGGTFTTASGIITLVLKSGNGSGSSGTYFDDIYITPEPTSLALLALGGLAFLRRRRVA